MTPRVEVLAPRDLHHRAAELMAEAMREALALRDRCSIALSGGRSPRETFHHLSRADLAWPKVDVFQVDERVAPDGHPDRNVALIEQELSNGSHLHRMPVVENGLEGAARSYERELVEVCGSPPRIDLVHLGIGEDGHIASLVPADPVLSIGDRYVAVTDEYGGYRRMTLTFPALEAAGALVLVVGGAGKAEALAKMIAGDRSVPAGRLIGREITVLADEAAARNVSASR